MTNARTLTKVAECLYRNGHGTYFALLKVRGKQIKKSLITEDSALARRRLADLRTKATGLAGEGRGMTFDDLAIRWLAFKKSDLREGSWIRLAGIIRTVKPFFAGLHVRSIGQTQIEAWKIKRGAIVSPRSFNYEREVLHQLFEYAREPKVHFEAPPSRQIPAEMSRFLEWFHDTAPRGKAPLPILTRAGIAHLYFVSIHPFEDGNGRIGRAIAEETVSEALGQPTRIALSRWNA